jgi:hypothetical protein
MEILGWSSSVDEVLRSSSGSVEDVKLFCCDQTQVWEEVLFGCGWFSWFQLVLFIPCRLTICLGSYVRGCYGVFDFVWRLTNQLVRADSGCGFESCCWRLGGYHLGWNSLDSWKFGWNLLWFYSEFSWNLEIRLDVGFY